MKLEFESVAMAMGIPNQAHAQEGRPESASSARAMQMAYAGVDTNSNSSDGDDLPYMPRLVVTWGINTWLTPN